VQLLLPREVAGQLVDALERAGRREIGGILMAEHVSENIFRVKSLTIQRLGGTFATFLRAAKSIITPLLEFFHETNHNYTRFNYVGEWHSHPSFAPIPSVKDHRTMLEIIEDRHLGALFVVLMIAKLNSARELEGTVTAYKPGGIIFQADLVLEG
jgi:[CysO sulfur-carrier protein]-S-L-cysteine hydrolase